MEDMPNRTADLKERFAELDAAYQGNITLHLAAENMLDNLFEERLAKNDLLPLGKDGRHLLVKPPISIPDGIKQHPAPHQGKRICPHSGTSRTVCLYG